MVKGDPMDVLWQLLKRQTTLGEHHPDFPSPYGGVQFIHATHSKNRLPIMRDGLQAWSGSGRHSTTYPGVFVTTRPIKENEHYGERYEPSMEEYENKPWWQSLSEWERELQRQERPMTFGIRSGAGTPQPYFGYGDYVNEPYGGETERLFPVNWRFMENVPPEFLVNMSHEGVEGPQVLPDFYDDDGKPLSDLPDNFDEWDDGTNTGAAVSLTMTNVEN